ncbi:uncharacterized protein LOC129294532 [Prosopis cineraria]|uniref:uncharacterized protein LOC129294532 n=1 Tax=Prosopis cineraria TaxID=364024 RepID=UPI00240EF863|nr:uncharacterized protein LOC129294532 [Prosopis cineraria]
MDIGSNSSSDGTENPTLNSNNPTPNSNNSAPASHNDSTSGTPSVREKKDPAWAHVALRKEGNKNVYTCLYCALSYKGGGINRLKHHLTGVSGNVVSCSKVSFDVRHQMQELLKSGKKRKLVDVQADMKEHVSNVNAPNVPAPSKSIPESSASKKKPPTMPVENYFTPKTTLGSQPDCPFFQKAVDAIASIGLGFKGLTTYEFRVNLLNDWKKELFMKFVDASDLVKDAKTSFSLFSEVIEWVGPKNVVHVVIDNAANYIACGKLIKEKYKSIYWSPCAAHCLNLTLKDIASMSHVSQLTTKASKITVFVYNHMVFLSWLRKRKGWKEIMHPGATRFATTFIILHSIYMQKHDLQALITDKHFMDHKLSRTEAGIIVSAIILDNRFWNECLEVVKIVSPLIKLLRIVDSDEKPSLPYVYEGMQRAKKEIKVVFNNKKDQYKPYTDIIQARWDKHLKTNLHAAAYLLNPAFLYDDDSVHKRRLMDAMLSIFESTENEDVDYIVMMKQLSLYCDRKESFDKASCHIIAEEEQEPALEFDADDVTNLESAIHNENLVASSISVRNNEGEEDMNISEHSHLNDDVGSGSGFS